ncbi:MAG: hypothetical protein HYZ65_10560 [Burkholderiales bacterium]|nr:hypothetical protein [Burkholderiales bacterium]
MNKENPDYRKDDNEISAQKLCAGTMSIMCNQTYRAGGLLHCGKLFQVAHRLAMLQMFACNNYIAVQKRDYTGYSWKKQLDSDFILNRIGGKNAAGVFSLCHRR